MTTTATPTDDIAVPEMLEGFASMHAAMRRDAARLPDAVAVADPAGASALVAWYARFRHTIELHHRREDDTVWPVLAERSPSFTAARPALEEDHHTLDVALAATTAALASMAARPTAQTRADAAQAAADLGRILVEHLAREEDAAFAELVRVVSPEEYDAMESAMLARTPLRALAFEAPWALTTLAPGARDRKLAGAPAPLRLLYRWSFLPRYQRLVQRAGM